MSLLQCNEHGYTLGETCPKCGKATARAGPAKYSPEDPYGKYRRALKLEARGKKGAQPFAGAPAHRKSLTKNGGEPT